MKEFREFQEVKEQNKESLEARLEARTQELLEKADALIESSAELLAEDSLLTKEEIIEHAQEESLKELGSGYTKEDFAPIGASSEAYSPSFGAWSKYDSTIDCKTNELIRDAKAGRRIAVENDLKNIDRLQKKRYDGEMKKIENETKEKAEKIEKAAKEKEEQEKKEAERKAEEEKERIKKEKEAAEKKAAEAEEKKRKEEQKKLEEKLKKEEEERKKKLAAGQK